MCFFRRKTKQNNDNNTSKIIKESSKQRKERECREFCDQLDIAIGAANSYLAHPDVFVDVTTSDVWINQYSSLRDKLTPEVIKSYKKAVRYVPLWEKNQLFNSVFETLKENIIKHNNDLAERLLPRGYEVIGNVEGRKLDKQQMISVVKPSKNHLIIAGAGTGKTTTVVGKIKYLLNENQYNPEDFLVLSFTNASASEMRDRIHNETGEEIEASTFHKLGLNIINSVEGKTPKIYSSSLTLFIREQLKRLMGTSDYMNNLCKYALYYRNPIREKTEFNTEKEYEDYLQLNAPQTLKGEYVKSYGEMDIANYLYQNGIEYVYEAPYIIDTNTEKYGQYHPDFYLPEEGIFIEYFGINRKGEVADYFQGRDSLSASETYKKGMEWKRKIHSENKTQMIECYAYEKFEDVLLQNLEKKLGEKNVSFKPLSYEVLWQKISEENVGIFEGLIELFNTVINLTKSNNYTIDTLETLVNSGKNKINNARLIRLIKPIFVAYDQVLKDNNEIDFNDMINIATKYVKEGKYVNPYKFVIVDEYQDISKARFNLLKALRESSDFRLFCVGDDWQSIYRFAGSDINYIVDFEKYWGTAEIDRIETTYRFDQSLIDISTIFIIKNNLQLRKCIRGVNETLEFALGIIDGKIESDCISSTINKFDILPQNSSVFLIGRYRFDINPWTDYSSLEIKYDNVYQEVKVKYKNRPDLKIVFMTAHRSKGLQADYVFIINNKDSRTGFPSKIVDAPILEYLLEAEEPYPYAEERRLFYVALTRAKKKVFLLTVMNKESVFAKEIMMAWESELDIHFCPKCGGRIIKRSGQYGEFYGCSNYRSRGCRYIVKEQENKIIGFSRF